MSRELIEKQVSSQKCKQYITNTLQQVQPWKSNECQKVPTNQSGRRSALRKHYLRPCTRQTPLQRTGSRVQAYGNFEVQVTLHMLDVLKRILPIDSKEWDQDHSAAFTDQCKYLVS